ncbi:MAG: hypothetical protein ACFUZC_09430 [Chthoniobacteraceae bacterium]
MASDWEIKARSHTCNATGKKFAEGEYFYTLLFMEKNGDLRREDLCEEAFKARDAAGEPYSFWRTKFEVQPPPPPEPIGKQDAEALLRQMIGNGGGDHASARYILALMLERKRVLKPVETKEENGRLIHFYLHGKTGEVFVIPDPGLRLDQIEAVQIEVSELLGEV